MTSRDTELREKLRDTPANVLGTAKEQFELSREAYLNLPFERVTDSNVARRILVLSAFFALDFQRNALTSLQYAIRRSVASPQRDESVLQVMMELVSGECCTTNILGPHYGVTSHFYPAVEAVAQCGGETSLLLNLAESDKTEDLPVDWQDFWAFQKRYLANESACFAVIGYCRELLLSNVFERLAKHLPQTEAFSIGRNFFERHVLLDTAEGTGHADLMRSILDRVITDPVVGYTHAAEFLTRRNQLYAKALGEEVSSFDALKPATYATPPTF